MRQLIKEAEVLIKKGYSDAYVRWALNERKDNSTSIKKAIQIAENNLKFKK